ncbi:sugar ABC transporter ATP-binding protein [Actinotalea sp. M2MS4P-6]|uniref:sugar ABC transporter ATP-binding protein n=1 Tax=Actinotalea sp. M2MS4P-6 TaxID=2983762 RepID=UPI0021E4A296|nr:sugar ABC transporter ATP-binding protein [Actinotalea sp. M2MS4P-6]MCV2394256.1 sugar ABC transporter ATP-binding protein [Actinotalea sp. M2MS4P-6]
MPELLEIRNVSKSFPGVRALSDVSLTLHHGEILGLCGENGAGKSTLMKLLTGIYTMDEGGEILLEGAPVEVEGPREAQHLGLSIIHQEFTLVPDLSVAQNIYLGREPRAFARMAVDDRKLNARAKELLDRLEIKIDPATVVRELSVARQQMVEIAKALSFDSRVLVMDEPTATLTDSEIHTLFELVRGFVTPKTGVIYISHRMDEVKELTDRVTVLRDGEMVGTVPTAETPIRDVIAMMVGRKIDTDQRPDPGRQRGTPVLEVRGLSTAALLKDVSFELHRGEILGFAGLMGAGRTEVARALVGADRRSAGEILIDGEPTTIHNPAQAVEAGIGYLSEDRKRYGLLLDQSVSNNVVLSTLRSFVNGVGLINDAKIATTAEEQVAALRVKTPSVRQLAKNLSGGNQQKVVLAKWLTRSCDILIVDEPTRGIDVGAKQEIHDLLVHLTDEGKSIIMISSELPEVLRLSDRIAVMCEGRITGIVPNSEATQESIMELATKFRTEGMGAA